MTPTTQRLFRLGGPSKVYTFPKPSPRHAAFLRARALIHYRLQVWSEVLSSTRSIRALKKCGYWSNHLRHLQALKRKNP